MFRPATKTSRSFLVLIAILVWFALILQFYLILRNRVVSVPLTIVRYFTFFTILSNIFVGLFCLSTLSKTLSMRLFSRPSVLAAITLYIAVVGIVYNTVLRYLWKPGGWDRVADELLHLVVPILFIVYWLVFAPKGQLKWKNIYSWIRFPIAYLVWVMLYGEWTAYYPYPFMDVNEQGYTRVLLNSAAITLGFLILSFMLVALDRAWGRKQNKGIVV